MVFMAALSLTTIFTACQSEDFKMNDAFIADNQPWKIDFVYGLNPQVTQSTWYDRNGKEILSHIYNPTGYHESLGAYNPKGGLQVINYLNYDQKMKHLTDSTTEVFYPSEEVILLFSFTGYDWRKMINEKQFETLTPDDRDNWTELKAKDGQLWLTLKIYYYDDAPNQAELDQVSAERDRMFAQANPPVEDGYFYGFKALQSIASILGPFLFPLIIILPIFAIFWAFKYKALRGWINRRAGVEVVPADRFNKNLLLEGLSIHLAFFFLFFPAIPAYYFIHKNRACTIGSKAAHWELWYNIFAVMAIILCFSIALMGIAFIIAFYLFDKVSKHYSPFERYTPTFKNTASDPSHSCSTCQLHSECFSKGYLKGEDTSEHVCDRYRN